MAKAIQITPAKWAMHIGPHLIHLELYSFSINLRPALSLCFLVAFYHSFYTCLNAHLNDLEHRHSFTYSNDIHFS